MVPKNPKNVSGQVRNIESLSFWQYPDDDFSLILYWVRKSFFQVFSCIALKMTRISCVDCTWARTVSCWSLSFWEAESLLLQCPCLSPKSYRRRIYLLTTTTNHSVIRQKRSFIKTASINVKKRPFARWRYFTTTTRILQGFAFLCKLGL